MECVLKQIGTSEAYRQFVESSLGGGATLGVRCLW